MAIRAKKSTTTTTEPAASTQAPVVTAAEPAAPVADSPATTAQQQTSSEPAPFGSPERIRQLATLIQIVLNETLASGNTDLVGPYTEIKHSLHELADLKEKLEAVKSLGLGI